MLHSVRVVGSVKSTEPHLLDKYIPEVSPGGREYSLRCVLSRIKKIKLPRINT